ncbi:MAG: 1-acyl-sn-glycerol-3-phosphate acyltransferase [Bacteroidales bacterium]|jgi:1-acyl-sn-glycerol-3-phosphate acyltransferase|nr:1-acyl-sn-glycerol-3-phosphate acyltransferase [Bacteroidales bacterium]
MLEYILRLFRYFSVHKAALWGLLALSVALLALASLRIRFREDISGFLSGGQNSERINRAWQLLGATNKLIVSVSMADTAAIPDIDVLTAAIDRFAEQLSRKDTLHLIRKTDYKIHQQQRMEVTRFIVENMPCFLTENDYQRMDSLLNEAYLRQQLNEGKRLLSSPVGMMLKQNFMADPLHLSAPLLLRLQDFQADDRYGVYHDYIFTKDRRKGIITIESAFPSSETGNNARLMEMTGSTARETEAFYGHRIKINCFGTIDIALTNARQIKKDSLFSGILAIILIFALLIYVFRNFRSILVIFVSLLFGWLFAFGLLAVLKTEIDLIVVGIASIITGIAVNYPLHLLDHYRHERDMKTAIRHIVVPLLIGNITTVGAFLSLTFINAKAMRDLGLFASLLLVGTILFVLIFVPHMRFAVPGKNSVPLLGRREFAPERNRWIVWTIVLLSVVFGFLSLNTHFETNMQTINYMTDAQRAEFEETIASLNNGGETVYFVSEGATPDEALTAYEQAKPMMDSLMQTGSISRMHGIGNFLPSKRMQRERIEQWRHFWDTHSEILSLLTKCAAEAGFRKDAFSVFENTVRQLPEVHDTDYFSPLTEMMATGYLARMPERFMVMNILHTPEKQTDRLEHILNGINSRSFAFDAGTISRSIVDTLSDDFNTVLCICGIIVFVFLFFTLGRIELSLLAFLPLLAGWFWILGIMNIFDIRFNIVNIILATLIFGQGDDYTIFITEGLIYENAYGKKLLASYRNSIVLSALIMFIGIGTLIFARHPALHSLAEVTVIGMLSVVLMTFVLPPVVFRLLTAKKGMRRPMPVTLRNFLATVYAFSVFLIGTIIITVAGFFLLTVSPKTERNKLRYHRMICRAARFVMNHFPQVRLICENLSGETFEKPAVIICNHQSHVDLMCALMLHPKIIVLTNDWVWNSPFYGRLIKYADFYPVSNGVEKAIDRLRGAVERGYSIMLFPEGTRSEDCSIKRFHKGAFYLAEQLQLDLLPLMIHGIGHVFPKKEFMLRKGTIHVRIMNRIAPQNLHFGSHYVERAKAIGRLYREQYSQWAEEIETADYYTDMVYHNYIYKGPAIERSVRKNLKRLDKTLIEQLTGYQKIGVKNCGYGEFSLLLALVCKHSAVTASDPDGERLAVAAHCAAIPANLRYTDAELSDDCFDKVIDYMAIEQIK